MKTIRVILVHGTFAQGAAWTERVRSEFCARLEPKLLPDYATVFKTFTWSGWNLQSHRLAAASRLNIELPNSHEGLEDTFVIAHSHGGNVLMHALGQNPTAARTLKGAIFLATPFIRLRWRENASSITNWLEFFVTQILQWVIAFFASLAVLIALSPEPLAGRLADPSPISPSSLFFGALAFCLFAVGPALWMHWGVAARTKRSLATLPLVLGVVIGLSYLANYGTLTTFFEQWLPALIVHSLAVLIVILGFLGLLACLHYSTNVEPYGPQIPRLTLAAHRAVAQYRSPSLQRSGCLFVRPDGDEASIALATAQLVTLLANRMLDLPRAIAAYVNPEIYFAPKDHPIRNSGDFNRIRWVTAAVFLGPLLFLLLAWWLEYYVESHTFSAAELAALPDHLRSVVAFFGAENYFERNRLYDWIARFMYIGVALVCASLALSWLINSLTALAFGTTAWAPIHPS